MLKRNLIAISIVVLGLGITSASGQDRDAASGLATGVKATRTSNRKAVIKKPAVTVKKPKQIQAGQNSDRTISNQRSSGNSFLIRKPLGKQMQQENNSTYQQIIKNNNTHQNRRMQPNPSRKGSKSKRQHLP
jgi:hypothetical protein